MTDDAVTTPASYGDNAGGRSWPTVVNAAGVAFAVLFAVGMLMSSTPDYDAPDEEWTAWFDDGGNRTMQIVSMFLLVLASMAFLVFLAGLVRALRARTTVDDPWVTVVFGAGLMLSAATAIAGIALNQVSAAVTFGGSNYPIPGGDVLRQSEQLGFGVALLMGGWSAALMIATASYVAGRTGAFPRWLVIGGYVSAVLLIVSVFFIPMLLLVLWVIAVSILLPTEPNASTRPTA